MSQFNCFFCQKTLISLTLLKAHVRHSHDKNLYDRVCCSQNKCRRTFKLMKNVYSHIQKDHSTLFNETLYDCEEEEYFCVIEGNNSEKETDYNLNEKSPHQESELNYALQLYSHLNLTRTDISRIIYITQDLLKLKLDNDEDQSFSTIDSEHKFIKELTKRSLYVKPKSVILGYKKKILRNFADTRLKTVPVSGQIFNLTETFKVILQSQCIQSEVNEYLAITNELLEDFKDGSKYLRNDTLQLPFVIFYDEIETGNPLGSRKGVHKLGAFYTSLRCFPTHHYSKLSNIYPLMLIPTGREYLNVALERLVEDINMLLKHGLTIDEKEYHFQFAGFIGDNLGLHQLFGFSEGFTAKFPCRFCKIDKMSMQTSTVEDPLLRRDKENYKIDLEVDDVSLSGINRDSILNRIEGFHVVENSFVDLMHDFAEGVGNYGMNALIKYLIKSKLITLDTINDQLSTFSFGDVTNKPPLLKLSYLDKELFPYSASEMLSLITYFGMIFGRFISSDCEAWSYYITLKNILSLLLLKSISKEEVILLKQLIKHHHELYLTLFDKPLKPKFHYLLHYPTAILQTGPVSHNWAMRFEGQNLVSKIFAKLTRCKINVCKSLATRLSFHFASNVNKTRNLLTRNSIDEVGPINREGSYSWIIYRGYKYRLKSIVNIVNEDDPMPTFFELNRINIKDFIPMFIVKQFKTIYFDDHSGVYHLQDVESPKIEINVEDVSHPICKMYMDGTLVVNNFLL